MSPRYALLVPVKAWSRAKSRLGQRHDRGPLMRAFALDALEAATGSTAVGQVYVVSEDPDPGLGAVRVLRDEGEGDLNLALSRAVARLRSDHPGLPVAAMCADLPCLRSADLSQALAVAGDAVSGRWFVSDAAGTGTSLLIAATESDLDPRFGPDSATRHRASGAVDLVQALAQHDREALRSLRLDVDTDEDLACARELGLGRHTLAVDRGR